MQSYHHLPVRSEGNNKWRTLLSCTGGRPIDPDVFPDIYKSPSSRKAKRERFVPLKESNSNVGVGRNANYPRELLVFENGFYNPPSPRPDTIVVPLAHKVRQSVSSAYSPSRSFDTRATATTRSSSSANDSRSQRRRHSHYSGSDLTKHHHHHQQQQPAAGTTTQSTATPTLTITASPSFGEDVSFLSFHIDDEDADEMNVWKVQEQSQQLDFWRRRASECFDRHGIEHRETATAFLELGLAHLRCEQYTAAQEFFRTALRVFEKKFGPLDLRVAKALESLGMAQSRGSSDYSCIPPSSLSSSVSHNKAGLLLGLNSYRKCFRIRYDVLGPTHIDTVETLNKIANIYMKLHMYTSAKNDYLEVLTLRTAILGEHHPSVAVAAKSLGIAHLQRQEIEQAKAYFLQALNVFAHTGLGSHPMAKELRVDIRNLGFDLNRLEI